MDLRKFVNKYYDLPLLILLIYYFNNKKRTKLENGIFILLIIALCINIILSFELVRTRYVSWNYFFLAR